LKNMINTLSINYYYSSISKGAILLKDIVYFISVIAIFLLATQTVIENDKA
jgi:hypothetical protein